MKLSILTLLAACALPLAATHACGTYGADLELYNTLDNGSEAEIAALVAAYRARGQAGLDAAIRTNELIPHEKLPAFIDQVAKQKDASRSGLFWFTDLDAATAAAGASGRSILSLRLLGKLDEEFSCANSRLFREVLYPDPQINRFLRENFVLHWQSVRPVPVMTIDYGDGRVLKRTITGNSAHYVLDERGRVVDALPGLYTPEKFLELLSAARQFAVDHRDECSRTRPASLAAFHQQRLSRVVAAFNAKLDQCGMGEVAAKLSDPIEMADLEPQQWAKLAAVEPLALAPNAAAIANLLTAGKAVMEVRAIDEFAKAQAAELKRTKLSIATAEDSARNEFVFHRRVHERFANGIDDADLDGLNRWVYAELFLMPDSDPWLGLHTPDVFTGIKDNGIVR